MCSRKAMGRPAYLEVRQVGVTVRWDLKPEPEGLVPVPTGSRDSPELSRVTYTIGFEWHWCQTARRYARSSPGMRVRVVAGVSSRVKVRKGANCAAFFFSFGIWRRPRASAIL